MASSRRTYDTDVITLRTVFARNPGNSNVPALRVLTADGQGGTYWAIPSTLGENPSFNRIVTTAGSYTADLSFNTFRLLAGENIGMVDGPAGSNLTYVFGKAFSQFDLSGENTLRAFRDGVLDSSVTIAGQNGITLRGDPGTNTLFIVGPTSNAYTVSTGIYGFSQLKVTETASTITSNVLGWDGTYITATSPSTLLRFSGIDDLKLSTNVTTNSVFFTISTFSSKGYLDISANAYGAYPSTLSTVSSLYVQQTVFNSTVGYLSSMTGFSFSSVVSTVNWLAASTGANFYLLTGLINDRVTFAQFNDSVADQIVAQTSTTVGLGTLGYISTATGAIIGINQLASTVTGLGTAGYISSSAAGDVTKADLRSTVEGLGTTGYISSSQLQSTVAGLGTASYISSSQLLSSLVNLGSAGYVSSSQLTSTVAALGGTFVSTPSLLSTVRGLGSASYVSSSQLVSSVRGLGSAGYLSTLQGFTVSSGNVITSSLNLLDSYTSATNFITISSGVLLVNGASVSGGGGGVGGGVAQLLAGANISLSPGSGTGIVTVTNTGPTISTINDAISSFSTALIIPMFNFSTISSVYGSSFATSNLFTSTMNTVNILPSSSNLWVAVGYGSTTPNSIQYSGDGLNWSNSTAGGFSLTGKGVAYNGLTWVSVGNNGGASGSIQVSVDGRSWVNATSGGFSSGGNGVAYSGSFWVAVGNNGGATATSIQTSIDGRTWSGITSGGFSVAGESVSWNGSYWVAVGQGASVAASIQYSIDGRTWVNASTGGFTVGGRGIAWNGSLWVAVGDDVTQQASIQYSGDGRNWSNVLTGGFVSAGTKVSWNGRVWIAVGDDNVSPKSIQYSLDGSNWSDAASGGFSGDGYGIAWNGFFWVAVGVAGSAVASIQTSRDGLNWTNASSGGFASGGQGVAFSSNLVPGYTQQGLRILSQNIPLFLTSTNQIFAQPSSLVIDNTLLIDGQWKRVGINCNTPTTDLDVNGTGRFLTASTQAFFLSSINGANYSAILPSTITGLGQIFISTPSLISTVDGLGAFYISTSGLTSTVAGLGNTYISTSGLTSTVAGLGQRYLSSLANISAITLSTGALTTSSIVASTIFAGSISTFSLEVFGPATLTNSGSTILRGPIFLGGPLTIASSLNGLTAVSTLALSLSSINGANYPTILPSTVTGLGQIYPSTLSLLSTTAGLGQIYPSTLSLLSTTAGLGQIYPSTLSLLSTTSGLGQMYVSSLDGVLTVSTLSLNVSSINGALPGTGSGNGSSIGVSTGALFASSMSQVNIPPPSSNLWVAAGDAANPLGTIKYSGDGSNWSNNTSGTGFDVLGNGVAYNGSLWVAVGWDTGGATIKYTTDPTDWSNLVYGGFSQKGFGVAWNGRIWVAVGEDNATYSIQTSTDGSNWNVNNGTGFDTGGYGVAWNGRVWLAVGEDSIQNNTIKYSYDGESWINSSGTGFATRGRGVAWNGRMWVAVGQDTSPIKYSYDGISWSAVISGTFSLAGYGIAWNGRMWVAVGQDATQNNRIKYSYDGLNWSNCSGVSFTLGRTIAWNGRMWIAGGQSTTTIYTLQYSYDGITWSNISSGGFTDGGLGVAFSSNLTPSYQQTNLQILPQGIPLYLTSTNQILATQSTLILNNTLTIDGFSDRVGINTATPQTDLDVFGTGRFQILSTLALNVSSINGALPGTGSGNGSSIGVSTGALFASSINGVNFPAFAFSTVGGLGQTYTSSLSLLSTVRGLGQIYTSSLQSPPPFFSSLTVSTGALFASSMSQVNITPPSSNLWVATGNGGSAAASLLYSRDGSNWSNSSSGGFFTSGRGVAWNGRLWVAGGSGGSIANNLLYSTDGINWTNSSSGGFSSQGNSLAWNGRLWVAVGVGSNAANSILYSTDGSNWVNSSSGGFTGGFSQGGVGVAWNGRLWVAVGDAGSTAGSIQYSRDGSNWTNSSSGGFSTYAQGIAWNGRLWVAVGVGTDPNIQYSTDGINWRNASSGGFSAGQGWDVAWNGVLWVAVGSRSSAADTIQYSTDGINWTSSSSGGFTNEGRGIAWTGRLWVAVGDPAGSSAGSIQYSTDGMNWTNSSSGAFGGGSPLGWGIAYSSNLTPSYQQTNLQILPQAIPLFLTSTNQILATQSTLILNTTLTIDGTWDRVGINTGTPQTELDVVGTGRFQALSTGSLVASTITSLSMSSIALTTSSLTLGLGNGWVTMGALQAVVVSTVQVNSALAYISSLYCGSTNILSLPLYTAQINGNAMISSLIVGIPLTNPSTTAFRLTLTADSATKPFTTAWTAASDQRVKMNIVDADYDRCYSDLKALQLRRFTWQDSFFDGAEGYDKRVLGFVAQEVSTIVPKAVRITDGYGYSNFHFLNVDQLHMSLYGAVKKTISDKEVLESTVKGQAFQLQTLQGFTTTMISTLEGLQGR